MLQKVNLMIFASIYMTTLILIILKPRWKMHHPFVGTIARTLELENQKLNNIQEGMVNGQEQDRVLIEKLELDNQELREQLKDQIIKKAELFVECGRRGEQLTQLKAKPLRKLKKLC